MNAVELNIFASRLEAVCDEMGALLRNAAFSPNIKDRLDFSCAVFDDRGELCAQAAHIPVHLGSMAYAMADIVQVVDWSEGDMLIVNDPYLGGTHLPDVTLVKPVFLDGDLAAFVANRAHHADIGAECPGSMPISRSLEEEGVVIPPSLLIRAGALDQAVLDRVLSRIRNPQQGRGDFSAQISANRTGGQRLAQMLSGYSLTEWQQALTELNAYGQRLAETALFAIPDGSYRFEDWMDDDGLGNQDLVIRAELRVSGHQVEVDFTGTAPQTSGNINCPLSVAAAGVYYVFRCLMPGQTPACAGVFRQIRLHAPEGCLLNARRPAAVAAGNVETSTRVVDVVLGALAQAIPDRIPAASHGSMNNLAMGAHALGDAPGWDYYETMGGGMGAGADGGGLSARQTHMTNTLNTPIEVLESHYPIRVRKYALRDGSGGLGTRKGGDGLVREFEFLAQAEFTLLTERRRHAPWGVEGGRAGKPGVNELNGEALGPKCQRKVRPGDRLTVSTAGGGGYGVDQRTPD